MTKISVITVTYNVKNSVLKTMESVLNQVFDDYEYIIIDGNSKDGTQEIIENEIAKYPKKKIRYISEKDNGVYDAMNKAVLQATGDFLIFLNGDDYFVDNEILKKFSLYLDKEKYDIVYGDLIFLNVLTGEFNYRKQDNITYPYLIYGPIWHPTIFANKNLFEKIGNFDTSYKIVADYDWILRAILLNYAKIKYVPIAPTIFSYGKGLSSFSFNFEMHKKEKSKIRHKYFSSFQIFIFEKIYKMFRTLTRHFPLSNFLNSYNRKKINDNYLT